jgi:hypothetical protein
MSAATFFSRLLAGFARSLARLRDAVSSPDGVAPLLHEFGWDLAASDLALVTAAIGDLSTLADDPSSLGIDELTTEIASAIEAVRRIASSGAPPAFASTFPRELLDFLVYGALAEDSPSTFAILHFLGIISERAVDADLTTGRAAYTAREIRWDLLPEMAVRPLSTVAQSYGWGTAQFDADGFLRGVAMVIRVLGGRANLQSTERALLDRYFAVGSPGTPSLRHLVIGQPPRPNGLGGAAPLANAGVKLVAMPIAPNASAPAAPDGIALIPVVTANASDTITLSDTVSLKLAGDFLSRPVRAEIHPDRVLVQGAPGDARIDASLRLDAKSPANSPWIALGAADSTRVEVSAAHARLALTGTLDGDAELRVEVGVDAAALVLDFGDSDGFVKNAISSSSARTPLSFTITWSSRAGFTFGGQAGLQLRLPVHQALGGGALLDEVGLALGSGGGESVALDLTASGTASIGPVTAVVTDLGFRVALEPRAGTEPAGNLGNVDVRLGFKSPSGVGLSIDASGVVTGSGFLYSDATQGTYVGALQLSLHETLTLTALGLIATRLPDGSSGYSLIVFITAEDFKPIPLGLGFTLQGIGGLVAINRTFDEAVIREGLRNDTLKTLLFPKDPVSNALAIVRSLESAFPARRGSYLLGILARIGWGSPTIIQFDLALILELGARERLIALGRVTALLPTPDNALLRLTLDALGVLDFDAGTVALDAMLVDSRLVDKFVISGGAALRAGWGKGRGNAFVLAVGGFNPRFVPPAGVPSLPRVAIALSSGDNPRLSCEAYFALTSNTVQFGARAQFYASAIGFILAGDVGFDVLFDSPVHFIADFHSSVQLKHGSTNLFKVSVLGTLEGLRPLRLRGKASFEILWCDFTVRVNATLVDGAPATVAAVNVLPLLLEALTSAGNWSTLPPPSRLHGVALRKVAPTPESGALVLDPLGRLAVTQNLVPLATGRDVELFNGAPVTGDARYTVSATLEGSAAPTVVERTTADFAPAQYFTMTEDEKLASPSFETMQAGVAIGSDAVVVDQGQLVAAPLAYDAFVIDEIPTPVVAANGTTSDVPVTPTAAPAPYVMPASQLAVHAASGAAARAPSRRVGRARFRVAGDPQVTMTRPRWAVVSATTGTEVPVDEGVETWSDYRAVASTLSRGGARYDVVAVA